MITHSLPHAPRQVAVLDVETKLDPGAASIAGHRSGSLPAALQRIGTACLLIAEEREDSSWTDFALHTLAAPLTEFDLLIRLDHLLADAAEANAVIVTYNGRAHDLAVLRRRAARHWMFGLPGLAAVDELDHIDVMLRQRASRRDKTPSLREACAGLGISSADPRTATGPALPPDVIKCQADVVATFLLALYEIAIERGSEEPLVAGWEGLSRHLTGLRPSPLHLSHFRDHPLLRAARAARTERHEDAN